MNKYQEALDYIVSNGTHETLYSWGDEIEVETEHGEESLNLLQELVDKETPIKPLHVNLLSNPPRNIIVCGNCAASNLGQLFKYCPNCGHRIDWSKNV